MRFNRLSAENVYGTLSSILNLGRKWGHPIPSVEKRDIVFPAEKKPKPQIFFFDADTAARVINAASYPFKLMFLIAALCGLRIGEVTALKVSSIDFKRKLLRVTCALDYSTRKESTPKRDNSAAPVHLSELLAKHLRDWLDKHYVANPDGYLFINLKGRPYRSENVIRSGVHRAMQKLGIETAKGVHVGIHCFRHGVTSELLESGTPIHVVTRLMRHADSNVTLEHYAHIIGDASRLRSSLSGSARTSRNWSQLRQLRPHEERTWRKRVGVELKSDSIKPVNLRRCSPHAPANQYKQYSGLRGLPGLRLWTQELRQDC